MGISELRELTIAEAGGLLRRRQVSAPELLDSVLQRAQETEPLVHAYALLLEERARRDAILADREMARGHWRGPLHGIPLGVKDLCYTRDAPTEAGSRVLAGFVPSYDATVVRRLRGGGAVLMGKTVTHEFAWGVNVPPTRNPWNLSCYPGGSSAGSGVSVAVRSAFGAIGTDTGGSIRIPAAVNNVVGLKPTFGRVSRYGVVPMSASLDHVGPLTRTVEDCALMLQVIAGHDTYDSGSIDHPVPDYGVELDAGVEGIVIGVERRHSFYPTVTADVRAAVESVVTELGNQGATIIDVHMPELELMATVGLTILLPDASTFHRRLLRERGEYYEPETRLLLELGELVPATHYVMALRARTLLRAQMRNLFNAHRLDALLTPTIPIPTAPLDRLSQGIEPGVPETPMAAYIHHTFSANVTGQPALSVPCGLTSTNLPIGFQLLGRPFGEVTLFRTARAYERTASWPAQSPVLAEASGVSTSQQSGPVAG